MLKNFRITKNFGNFFNLKILHKRENKLIYIKFYT